MGITVVDAGVVIGFLDATDAHHEAARQAFEEARNRRDRIMIPASALAESLVGPARRGEAAVALVQAFVAHFPLEVVPLDAAIATAAARLRAKHGARLPLPDALVIATAQGVSADLLVTTDRGWPSRSRLDLRGELALL